MKMKLLVLTIALQCLAAAQDKINVPLSKPGQPVTVHLRFTNSAVTINAGAGNEVTVESVPSEKDQTRAARRDKTPAPPPGMKRIDVGRLALEIEEKDNDVTLRDSGMSSGMVIITVPAKTSVIAKTTNGKFTATGLDGNLEVDSSNGSVTLTKISGAAVIHNHNGSIHAELDRVSADQPMSFTTMNGQIDVTLPAPTKAKFKIKAEHGSIYSDFDMKLEAAAKPEVQDTRSKDGRYRVKLDHSVTATINGGGPEYLFQSMNGSILIHKK